MVGTDKVNPVPYQSILVAMVEKPIFSLEVLPSLFSSSSSLIRADFGYSTLITKPRQASCFPSSSSFQTRTSGEVHELSK